MYTHVYAYVCMYLCVYVFIPRTPLDMFFFARESFRAGPSHTKTLVRDESFSAGHLCDSSFSAGHLSMEGFSAGHLKDTYTYHTLPPHPWTTCRRSTSTWREPRPQLLPLT